MFTNVLFRMLMPATSPRPSFWIAAWHVSRNTLPSIVTFSRVMPLCVLISTSDPPKPGMQSVSSNTSPLTATSSASTSMREYPVNFAAPGSPVAVVRVSDLFMSRTALAYVPGSTTTVAPAGAASIAFCRPVLGSASMTYAPSAHSGSTYTDPSAGLIPMSQGSLVVDATPTRASVAESITITRGSV